MPAEGGDVILVGGAGDDLLVAGAHENFLVGGFAFHRAGKAAQEAMSCRAVDDYFRLRSGGAADCLFANLADGKPIVP
jgi:hypothetical protein